MHGERGEDGTSGKGLISQFPPGLLAFLPLKLKQSVLGNRGAQREKKRDMTEEQQRGPGDKNKS